MAGQNPFLKAFENAGAFQTSLLDELPQYSLLSLDVPEHEEDKSLLQLGFGDEDTPISEVAPAENSAQRWDRQADALHAQIENALKPSEPRKSGFFHTYNEIFNQQGLKRSEVADILGLRGNNYLKAFGRIDARATGAGQDGLRTPHLEGARLPGVGMSDDAWHAQFKPHGIGGSLPTSEEDWRSMFPAKVKGLQAGGFYPTKEGNTQNIRVAQNFNGQGAQYSI